MQVQKTDEGVFIRLDRGEQVLTSLQQAFREANIRSGIVQAIGALEDVELGYFVLSEKQYRRKKLEGIFELLAFSGNISQVDGQAFLHAHAVIGDPEFRVWGGHFFDAKVAVTMEVFVYPVNYALSRQHDTFTGLKLWHL